MSNTLVYAGLRNTALKATTATLIGKFWDAELKHMGVQYQGGEPGVKATIEQIGTDHFVRTFQSYALDSSGAAADGYQLFSLGELAASKEAESELVQFEVVASRVDSVLSDAKLGLLKTKELYEPLLLIELPSGSIILGGGRHRLTAILTAYKVIEGWESIEVAVKVREVNTLVEAVNLITASNGSRSMTGTEKAQLSAATRGISVVRSPEEIIEQLTNLSTAADIKNVAMLYFVARGSGVLGDATNDTLGKIGSTIITNLTKSINTLGKGAALRVFNYVGPDGSKIAKLLIEYAFDVAEASWDDLMDSIKEPIKDRKSGGFMTDENGNTRYSINVARNTSSIAKDVSDSVFASLEDKLTQVFETAVQQEAAAKAAAAGEKQARAAQRQVSQVESALDYLNKLGIPLTPEQSMAFEQARIQAEQQAAAVASAPPQGGSDLQAALNVLLG